jgi:hypothetical protein
MSGTMTYNGKYADLNTTNYNGCTIDENNSNNCHFSKYLITFKFTKNINCSLGESVTIHDYEVSGDETKDYDKTPKLVEIY